MRTIHIFAASLLCAAVAAAQQGVPPQPAAGQPAAGTAAATAGKQTSDAGPAVNTPQAPTPGTATPSPQAATPAGYGEGGVPVSTPQPALKKGELPTRDVDDPTDVSDLLPPRKMPQGTTTLIGGIVRRVDPVNQRLTIKPFGKHASSVKVIFDARSHVYRNGHEVSPMAIHKGERVYLDTQLDPTTRKILARNVRVQTKPLQADASGQVVSYDPSTRTVVVKDELSAQNVSFHVLPTVTVDNQGHPGAISDVQPGAIVDAHFIGGQQSGRNDVKRIVVMAAPGADYIFDGRVTNIDVRNQTIAVENGTDGQIYDLQYDPRRTPIGDLEVGAQVSVTAKFDGAHYRADSLTPAETSSTDEDAAATTADSADTLDLSADSDDKSAKKSKKSKKPKKDKDKDKDDSGDVIPD